jgi:hypothetical protein
MPALAGAGGNATITVNLVTATGATIFSPDLKQLQLDVFNDPSSSSFYSQSMADYRPLWVRGLASRKLGMSQWPKLITSF